MFFALSEIHAGSIEQGRYSDAGRRFMKPSSQSKTELVQGWTQLPLETRDEAKSWFLDKQHSGTGLVASAAAPPPSSGLVPPMGLSSSHHSRGSASLDTTTSTAENEPWAVGMNVPAASGQTPDSSFDLGVAHHHVSPQGPWGPFGIETPGMQQNNLMMGQPVYQQQQQHQGASPATSDTRSMTGQLPESSTRARHQGRASMFAKDNENIYF